MGKLIKNHLARLVTVTAATYQVWAAFMGFFWPKVMWDFQTKLLDHAVKPVPILQILNLIFGLLVLGFEVPLEVFARTKLHEMIEVRLILLPSAALLAAILYQGTNPAAYYIIAIALYFWAYTEGEIICPVPWELPKKSRSRTPKV